MRISHIMLLALVLVQVLVAGCGSSGGGWMSKLGPGARETSAWMAGGKWGRCGDGDYAGRSIDSISERITCVDNPTGGKICTYYYSGVFADSRVWYQDKFDLYVNDVGVVKGCVANKYRLGSEPNW